MNRERGGRVVGLLYLSFATKLIVNASKRVAQMSALLFIHIFAVAFWLGCVAVEIVVEQVGLRNATLRPAVPQLHFYVDRFVEIPAFSTVLITGLLMFDTASFTTDWVYATKVICGLLAVGANIYSIYPVIKRKYAADAGDKVAVRHYGKLLDATVPVGLPAALVALGIGLHWAGLY